MPVIDSLPRAIRLLKQKDLQSQCAAVRLAGHLEGIFLGTHDRDVLNTLNAAVLALRAAFSIKAVDPVAVVDFAALVAQEVQQKQLVQSFMGKPLDDSPAVPVDAPVAPVEPPAPVEAVAAVEPVAEENATGKGARAK